MAKIGEQPSGALTRRKMMSSAVMLFFEKGYHNTTTAEIARRVGMSNSSFFRAFENKEAVLRAFVEYMFDLQFEKARNEEPLMVYAVETAVQMHIAEMNEQLRDLYVSAYSLPTTSEYIHRRTAEKLKRLFEEYMPDAEEQDFYEIDIATSGIARGYIVNMLNDSDMATRVIKVCHTSEQVAEELNIIVDNGGCVADVMVTHRAYGKVRAGLNIKNRRDVKKFVEELESGKSTPLLNVTSGYHFHTVMADSEEALDEIENELAEKGFLAEVLPYEKVN